MKEFIDSNNMLFLSLAALQVADVITGVLCVKKRESFDAKKLRNGIFKKIGDWLSAVIAFLAGHVLVRLGTLLEIDFAVSRSLGWLVIAALLYKECRSVFENLQTLGAPVPKVLSSALLLAEKEFDGTLTLPSDGATGMNLQLNKPLDQLSNVDTIHVKVQK